MSSSAKHDGGNDPAAASPQTSDIEKTLSTENVSRVPHENAIAADKLARKLSARQVQMIAIGGTIGTGLFLGTGKSLATGGPASMLLCYAIVGAIVFITMLCLGEMAAFVPIAGSFCTFAGLLKVVTIIIFIILGIAVNCGGNTDHHYIGGHNWFIGDAPFVGGIGGFASVFVTAAFAYGGTESIAITAGETKDPARTMPKVVRNVFWRILLFYVLSILILGLDVPYTTPDLDSKDTRTSPFTLVFQMAGSTAAGSFINAVIMTSVISAANHALFAGTRLLYTLAVDNHAPRFFSSLNRNQVPWIAVLATSAISILCFGASFIGAGQLWTWLQNIVGVSNQLSWIAIGIASLRFRAAIKAQNKDHLLPYKNWTYPWGPWFSIILNSFLVLVQGWSSFSPSFSTVTFFSLYIELLIMLVMYVGWKALKRTRIVRLQDMDLETDTHSAAELETPLDAGGSRTRWRERAYTVWRWLL
ncbi:MAG: hypothetical protein Q9191_006132 [Dirinaria sp. TL-2023a]